MAVSGRPIAILGAATSIGIRPYDDGTPRGLDQAPGVLRSLGLVSRLGAEDFGDLPAPPYRDLVRPPSLIRNEADVGRYNAQLADRIVEAGAGGRFVVLLGGDCSIVLAALAAARKLAGGSVGLGYVDAHADFAAPDESVTGSAASMCLSMAVGRGETPLAGTAGDRPLVEPGDVVLIGRRDEHEPYGHEALRQLQVPDVPYPEVRARGANAVATEALAVLSRRELGGFWIHVDADVLDATVMPAVDSPTPEGPSVEELVELVAPLARHPKALGLELTIYDPVLDPDRSCAGRLVDFLEGAVRGLA